jgi:thioredoxin-like negative regulator of GroEL
MEDRPAIVEVTSANFDQIVINSENDVLIEFYTQVQTAYCALLKYSLHVLKSQKHMRR